MIGALHTTTNAFFYSNACYASTHYIYTKHSASQGLNLLVATNKSIDYV